MGPDHSPSFKVKVSIDNKFSSIGKGKSIKESEKDAARILLEKYIYRKKMKKNNNIKTSAGFVALIGATNSGKSTLINTLVGKKVSIVTQKVQTTRNRIRAIIQEKNCQIILVDTPGIFFPKKKTRKGNG